MKFEGEEYRVGALFELNITNVVGWSAILAGLCVPIYFLGLWAIIVSPVACYFGLGFAAWFERIVYRSKAREQKSRGEKNAFGKK